MASRSFGRLVATGAALLLASGAAVAVSGAASAATPTDPAGPTPAPVVAAPSTPTLYASPTATAAGVGTSCATAKYPTISAAVASAAAGDTVVACHGTYTEDVVVQQPLTLVGESATINATGLAGAPTGTILGQAPYNGITIEASSVTVKGFTVEGAQGEGILAVNPSPVTGPVIGGRQLYTGTP